MSVEAIFCAREYYTIDALSLIARQKAQFGLKSHEKLMEDITAYKTVLAERLAAMLWDYTALAVFGEMRHASTRCDYYNTVICGGARNSAYEQAKAYEPLSILKAGMELFDPKKTKWSSSYGGAAWYKIASCVSKRSIMNNGVFCDMCFDLSHNSGIYLNKTETNIFGFNYGSYTVLLDYKHDEAEPENLVRRLYSYVSKTLKKLVNRAVALNMIKKPHDSYYFEMHTKTYKTESEFDKLFDYKPVKWGGASCPSSITETHAFDEDEDEDDEEEQDEYDDEELYFEEPKSSISTNIGWLDSFFYATSTAKNNSKRGAA